ncbi:MAG: tyrosine-type recombinase/integrase, partial [Pseudomonadota bacterium]
LYLATREAWFDQTKTDQPRMIHYPARTAELLAGADLPEVGAVFRTPKGAPYVVRKGSGGQIERAFKLAREAAGLGPDVTPYILRHTWATWFYAQTRDFGALMDLGGWAKADTANRYRKIAPADLGDRLAVHGWRFGEDAAPPKKTGDVGEIRGDRVGESETLRVFRGLRRS